MWEYRENLGEPLVPTKAGKTTGVVVYDRLDDMQSMLFPVHKACLEILYRLCQTRQTQDGTVKPGVPETIEALLEFGERLDLVLWETCHIYATCQAYRAEAEFQHSPISEKPRMLPYQ